MARFGDPHARLDDESIVPTRLLGRIALAVSASVVIFATMYFFVLYIVSEQ